MGRRRQNNNHLPKHWQLIHGAYYYRVPAMHRDLFDKGRIWLGRTLSEAHRAFADLPVHDDAEVQLVHDLAEKYRSEVIPTNAKGTQKNKLYYIEFILALAGKMNIHAVRAKHAYQIFERVKKVVSKRSETNGLKTAREVVALFRHMFTKGVEWGYLDRNPIKGEVVLEKPKPRRRYITPEELELYKTRFAPRMIAAYIGLKQLTGMDKQMMLSLQLSDIRENGIHTQRRKNNALPKIYPWDEGGKLKSAIDDIKKANIPRTVKGKHSKPGSIWLFHNRNGKSYLPMQDGRVFDSEGRAFGKPSGFDSIWQRAMAKWKAAGHEGFTEHDIRKVPASATSTQHAQELLDHQSPEITKRVYQVAPRVVSIDPQNEGNK